MLLSAKVSYNHYNLKTYKKLLCVILLIIFIVVLCNRVYKIFLTTPDIGGIESTIIRKVQLLLLDKSLLYTNPQDIYFEITQYSPLYFWVLQFFSELFGINFEDIEALYKLNRLVCLLLNLLTVILIVFIAKKLLSLDNIKTLFISVVFFSSLQSPYWGRIDSLSLLFFACFLYFIIKFEKIKHSANLLTSLLFLILATLTKQIFIIYFIPIFIFYGNKPRALLIIAFCIIINLLLFAIIFSQYPFFFHNIVLGVNNGYNLPIFLKAFLLNYFLKEGLLYIVLVFYFIHKAIRFRKINLLQLLLFFGFLFNFIASLKQGASPAYFTESFLIALLLLLTIELNSAIVILIIFTIALQVSNNLGFIFATKTQEMSKHYKSLLEDEMLVKKKIIFLNSTTPISFYTTTYNNQSFLTNLFLANNLFPQKDIIYNCAFENKSYPYEHIEKALTKDLPIQWYVVPKDDNTDPIKNKFKEYILKDSTKFYYIYKKNI